MTTHMYPMPFRRSGRGRGRLRTTSSEDDAQGLEIKFNFFFQKKGTGLPPFHGGRSLCVRRAPCAGREPASRCCGSKSKITRRGASAGRSVGDMLAAAMTAREMSSAAAAAKAIPLSRVVSTVDSHTLPWRNGPTHTGAVCSGSRTVHIIYVVQRGDADPWDYL